MNANNTELALSKITDAGFFEKLATAVLREADCNYKTLSHPGVNEKGKTVRSPLDGICFIPHAQPRHLIAVHHTTGEREKLEAKWLHDPSRVKTKNGKKPTAPAGDVLKTAEIIDEERKKDPSLEATLILTTNEEPSEALIRKIKQAEKNFKFHIDIWSRSRISHFLDNEANGQWIRNNYFGEKQQLLSHDLLKQISKQSLDTFPLLSDESSWVERELEKDPEIQAKNGVVFISGHSGSGKSVLCHRLLSAHIDEGGYGLVITHDIVSQSNSLEQAIKLTLDQYYSDFASSSPSALSLCSKSSPLLLLIEDINKSSEPKHLVSKILNWMPKVSKEQNSQDIPWKIICPLWPEVITSLDSQEIQKISPLVLRLSVFNKSEGMRAISAKAKIAGIKLSKLETEEICTALGYDPLLIALHIMGTNASEADTISNYVHSDIEKCSSIFEGYTKIDFLSALRKLGGGMLNFGSIEHNWDEVIEWEAFTEREKSALANLVKSSNIIRLSERLEDCNILFRHDRVRDWVMSDAAITMYKKKELTTEIISDPYFSELTGAVLVSKESNKQLIDSALENNPLALFCAFQIIGNSHHYLREDILIAISSWLVKIENQGRLYSPITWEALGFLSKTVAKEVPALVERFKDNSSFSQLAKLRNGDLIGAVELCANIDPGTGAPWRDQIINHALECYGDKLTGLVEKALKAPNLNISTRRGLLRLAGYLANEHLGQAIESCWKADSDRDENLENYFWAVAHCCGNDPERYLAPICDAWAKLPDKSDQEHMSSPRDSFAAHEIRWAFRKYIPKKAINYLISRASDEDLKWPITYLFNGIDNPEAVKFTVNYMAEIQKDLEGTESFSPFIMSAADEWNGRRSNSRRHMSDETRSVLADLWMNTTNEKYIRISAFRLWDATQRDKDLETLSSFVKDTILSEKVLASRLKRSDHSAIPDMISKIDQDNKSDYWWYFGRHLWSKELTEKLDNFLSNREKSDHPEWGVDKNADHITSELMQNMNPNEAERILLKHWPHLKYSPCFLQTALYIATPESLSAAHKAMTDCPEPKKMMQHASMHIGIRTIGRSGITKKDQLLAFIKYTKFLSDIDILSFWEVCNEHGWLEERHKYLDRYFPKNLRNSSNDSDALIESLNKTVSSKHHHWIDHDIESLLKTGVSWNEIIKKLTQWLSKNQDLSAFKIVCDAIQYKGNREDLKLLEIYRNKTFSDFCELIDDTIFTVKRRSAH